MMNGVDCQYCTATIKKVRGCEEPRDAPAKIGKYETYYCPRTYMDGKISVWIEAFNQYKNGFFPSGTGWLEQSMKLLQTINLIESLIEEFSKKE